MLKHLKSQKQESEKRGYRSISNTIGNSIEQISSFVSVEQYCVPYNLIRRTSLPGWTSAAQELWR